MPSISMFYGIVIYLYYLDHDPPHFHARYQDHEASFDLHGEVTEGSLPQKQEKLVSAWALLHEEELEANWRLASEGQEPYRIDPLK